MEKEYELLRTEIERRSAVQQTVFVLNLTAVGAIVALALKSKPVGAGAADSAAAPLNSAAGYFLMLLIPYVGFALARLWLDHHEAIARAGRYIRSTLEPRSDASWETYLQALGRSTRLNHYMFFFAYAVVFVGPGVVAIVATAKYSHGFDRSAMWSIAVALELLNLAGWIVACWPSSERSVPLARLRTMFEPRVRTRLDWDRLSTAGVEVVEYYAHDRSDYRDWWMPWYYENRAGLRTEVQEEHGGYAIRVLDCGRLPTHADGPWDPKVQTVAEFDEELDAAPMKFDVCVYAVETDGGGVARIVLDGNHHLAAALRSGHSFAARVFEIRKGASDDTDLLQDLGRDWFGDGRRAANRTEAVVDAERSSADPGATCDSSALRG
jgi:hypothetical protein